MIIIKIQGGLGNQMFQYALGRNLALLNNTKLLLDVSSFEQLPDRNYGLDKFNIKIGIANNTTLKKISALVNPEKNIFQKVRFSNYLYIKQPDFDYIFNSEIAREYDKHLYLDGYWQSEKYFLRIKEIIRQEFSLQHLIPEISLSVLDTISSNHSVSLHVRRGDYVSNNISNEFHGLCSPAYYNKACDHIREQVPDPYFFVFSDDIDWCKNNLNLSGEIFFVENKEPLSNYKDLYMMTRCKHHIIANSSFSWWGAWLGANIKGKIVVAPKDWFNEKSIWYKEHAISSRDIIPENWIQL